MNMAEESLPRGGLDKIKKEIKKRNKAEEEANQDLFQDIPVPSKKKRKMSIDSTELKHVKNGKQEKLSLEGSDIKNGNQEVLFTNRKKKRLHRKDRKKQNKNEMMKDDERKSLGLKEPKFNAFQVMKPQELMSKHVRESMLILGYVKEISDTHMMMALPNGRRGHLPITNISDGYLDCLKKFAETSNEVTEKLHSLSELFKVGMLLPCKVVRSKEKRQTTVPHLSINPTLVNEHLTKENLTTISFFYGSISGLEDTGYIVETGVEDSLCFLNNKHAVEYIQTCNNGERLKIGQCIRCKVLKKSKRKSLSNEKYLPVTIDPNEINKGDINPSMSLSELNPGLRVKVEITQITKDGLIVSCLKKTGFVHYSQLPNQLTTYTAGDELECCVLYINHGGQTLTLTALPHIVNYTGEPVNLFGFGTLCVGHYITDAMVSKVKEPKGVFFKLEGKAKGFANMENINENEEYTKGSTHRCIVTSIDYNNNKVQVSLKMDTIKELIHPSDLVGVILTGTVVSMEKDNARLSIWDKLNGVLSKGRMHKDCNPTKGEEIKCRVIAVNNGGVLRLSNLPSVLEATGPVITQIDQLDIGQHVECFAQTMKKSLDVHFYGDLEANVLDIGKKHLKEFENWDRIWCTVKRVKHHQLYVHFKDESVEIDVPVNKIGLIIGKGGQTIGNIRRTTHTHFDIEDGKIRITGTEENIEEAKARVLAVIQSSGSEKSEENDASESGDEATDKETKRKRKLSDNSDDNPDVKKEKVEIVTKTLKIQRKCTGSVIGIGGKTVKELAMKSGAKINIKDDEGDETKSVCEFSGSKVAVKMAIRMVKKLEAELLENFVSEEFTIPVNKPGIIIGKGGRTINQIQKVTNTRISVKNELVVINGAKKDVEQAKQTVLEIIQSEGPMRLPEIHESETASSPTKKEKLAAKSDDESDSDDDGSDDDEAQSSDSDEENLNRKRKISGNSDEECTTKKEKSSDDSTVKIEVWIPHEFIGCVIGKGGSIIKDIVEKSGARVKMNKETSEGADRTCQIIGTQKAVKEANKIIESLMEKEKSAESQRIHEEFSIPKKLIGKVIGKKGSTITGIRDKSGAQVFIKENEGTDSTCVITGTEEAVKTAQEMLNNLLNDTEVGKVKSSTSTELLIPSDMVGRLIGKRGQTVKHIAKESGAKINIKDAETEGADRICEISGQSEPVEKAIKSIKNLLERSSFLEEEFGKREVKDLEEDASDDGEPAESGEDGEEQDSDVVVTVLVPSDCVERLKQDMTYAGLQTDSRVKLTLEHEEEEMEGVCHLSGEEEVVMKIKKKLEKLFKKLGKKTPKKIADKPTLQLTDSISWDTEFKIPKNKDAESSSEDETEEKPVKKTKKQLRKEKQEEEKRLHEYEMKKLEGEVVPETADDFDRLVVTSPDSSVVWLRYMAFHLETSEIDKAREVAERALKTISFREDREKQNVWVAYLNLENMYGTKDSLSKVLSRAIQYCEPLEIYLPLANIYMESDKIEDAERIYSTVVKKYSGNKMVWAKFGEFYFQQNRTESARNLLQRSLKALENRDHVETITKFAQLEFKYGEPERGKTMFENILGTYPKRTDIWSVYVDLLTKLKDYDATRAVYRKMISQKLQAKKIKFFFKKYLEFEEKYGTEAQAEEVKKKALQFVELGGIQE